MTLERAGRQAPSASAVTLRDIAKHCGVSAMTVSRALRDDPRVHAVTKARIAAAAKELGYDPHLNATARRLSMQRFGRRELNHLIALLVPKTFQHTVFFTYLLKGILDVLEGRGYGVLTCYPPTSAEVMDMPIPFSRDEIDGMILPATFQVEQGIVDLMHARPSLGTKPIVSLLNPFPGAGFIGLDGISGGYQIGNHLLALGHRHLIHYYRQDGYEQMQRLTGVRNAFIEHGLDPDRYLHSALAYEDKTQPVDASHEEYLGTTWNALQVLPHATALIARNDRHAGWLLQTLTNQGIRIPGDLSIVGYDDSDPFFDVFGQNWLTSVRVPLLEIGKRSAEMMLQMIEGNSKRQKKVILPVELIARHSTGSPRLVSA